MTYSEWYSQHHAKRITIQQKLEGWGLTPAQVIDYFSYDNMRVHEPSFCPLYAHSTKCHDIPSLNCYLCACPHFKCSDTPLHTTPDGQKVLSTCSINSRHATTFTVDNNSHCDCSSCTIPHTAKAALKHYEHLAPVEDTCSILEHIRGWQLSDIFGKFKIF